ncbi:hypothetical protein [Heyndrickxia camelliae]|uniref:Uncharacterized protein n=1 Tax=Heyndrickxia camelliae TaxID=1707093 RepID=A0A2N3LD51_9BACI|nr:hypothetical protein [Heyndrickxia camelliae]PKR82582.1 hypothetical protein CWO92_23655 [Heyndrickxia camelliae]
MEQTLLHFQKHNVSDKALEILKQVMYKQDDFGVNKYGVALDHSHKYDWLKMLQEELADGLKYLQCEMERKEYIINLLKAGLRSDEPKTFIEVALELLTMEGTGK